MIWGNRQCDIEALGAHIETAYILDVKHRLHAYRQAGIVDDSLLHKRAFGSGGLSSRPHASFVLRGRELVRAPQGRRWLEAGEGYVVPRDAVVDWRLEQACAGLVISWDESLYAVEAPGFFRVPPDRLAALQRGAALMHERSSLEQADATHAAVLQALGAADALPASVFGAATACVPIYQALNLAIDGRLSHLGDEPMQIELQEELDISERHLRRLTTEMFACYGFVDSNWGEARIRRRLTTAVAFMSSPAATVTEIAREVGYRSSQVMSRAFLRAGYPAPSRVRETLELLAQK